MTLSLRRLALCAVVGLMFSAPVAVPPASAQVTTNGVVGGWTVGQHYRDRRFFRCFAKAPGSGNTSVLLSFMNSYDRLLTIDGNYAPVGSKDRLFVVLEPGGQRYQFDMIQKPNNGLWTVQALPNSFFRDLERSSRMDTETQSYRIQRSYRLGNPWEMMSAMDNCLNGNRGR